MPKEREIDGSSFIFSLTIFICLYVFDVACSRVKVKELFIANKY